MNGTPLSIDRVADVLVELAGDVGPEDGHVGALVGGCPGPTLGVVELERLEPLVARPATLPVIIGGTPMVTALA